MSVRSANQTLAIIFMALLCSACIAKSSSLNSVSGLDTKSYHCHELKQLVADREQVHLRGFLGSTSSVFASSDACNIILERPALSVWRTIDEFSCVAGFRCIDNNRQGTDF